MSKRKVLIGMQVVVLVFQIIAVIYFALHKDFSTIIVGITTSSILIFSIIRTIKSVDKETKVEILPLLNASVITVTEMLVIISYFLKLDMLAINVTVVIMMVIALFCSWKLVINSKK